MEVTFVQLNRVQATRQEGALVISRATGSSRVADPAPSGLSTPFSPGAETAGAVRANLAAQAVEETNAAKPIQPANEQTRDATGLTEAEQQLVADLSARDNEVRNHEEAHARVGGEFAGTPSYTYQTGPDGKNYAIGGEVPIDVAPVPDDPAATIDKMEVVKAAALAPAEPSGQDRRVAAMADANRQQAIADLAELRRQTEPMDQPSFSRAA